MIQIYSMLRGLLLFLKKKKCLGCGLSSQHSRPTKKTRLQKGQLSWVAVESQMRRGHTTIQYQYNVTLDMGCFSECVRFCV